MTFGLVHASHSLPKGQAAKLTFFAPCSGNGEKTNCGNLFLSGLSASKDITSTGCFYALVKQFLTKRNHYFWYHLYKKNTLWPFKVALDIDDIAGRTCVTTRVILHNSIKGQK